MSQNNCWLGVGRTDKGPARSINEDALFCQNDKQFWGVADGLGGHEIGDVASKKVVDALSIMPTKACLADCADAIEDSLIDINDQLIQYSKSHINGGKMGSTIVCLHIKNNVGICLWVGDSRLYRLRKFKLKSMTRDHSFVEELVKRGRITREEAQVHPERNIITRAVGTEPDLKVEVSVFGVQSGDTYMLCSDGMYESLDDKTLIKGLAFPKPTTCADQLLKYALSSPAKDNVSVVVVKASN